MSNALSSKIRQRITDAGGWLSFEAFMREALYAPDSGYYEGGDIFGKSGDFITGADVGPWLALGINDLIVWGWVQLGRPQQWTLLEQGGGQGRVLCDVLEALAEKDCCMPTRVIAVETSAYLRQQQELAYAELGVDVVQVASLEDVPAEDNILFFCNELPDAFPVRCFTRRGGGMRERGVGLNADGDFVWLECESDIEHGPNIAEKFMDAWPDVYSSEWNPHLDAWQSAIGRIMQRGLLFCVDYGFAQSEYYRAQRIEGTLLAHFQHETTSDVLGNPGSRDITAHIDFTALGLAGHAAGFTMNSWMTQGAWLAQSPSVQASIQQAATGMDAASVALLAAAKRMLLPQGMGDLFKISMQSKGINVTKPDYLTSFDRVSALGLSDA